MDLPTQIEGTFPGSRLGQVTYQHIPQSKAEVANNQSLKEAEWKKAFWRKEKLFKGEHLPNQEILYVISMV